MKTIRTSKPMIIICGDNFRGGTYVLRLRVRRPHRLAFGKYKRGKIISVPAGEYVYVGSSLNALAPRLLRHATRSAGKRSHSIRKAMFQHFESIDLFRRKPRLPTGKTLRWQIDSLLDKTKVDLVGVCAIRSKWRLEQALGQVLEHDPNSSIIERGIGASDLPGNTYFLRIESDEEWWQALPGKIMSTLEKVMKRSTSGESDQALPTTRGRAARK